MKGHQARVCRVAFHPSGEYVASASFDTTWRLWDVNTSEELLLQEGHSKEVYCVEFQNDGALAASGYVCVTRKSLEAKLTAHWSGGLMPLAASGTCELGDLPWFSMDTYKQYFRLGFHPMGSDVFSSISYRPHIHRSFFVFVSFRYQIATGAGDDTIRIWDMRSLKAIYTIPAHLSNVSDIRFFYANDLYFKPSPPASDVAMDGVDIDNTSHDTPDSTGHDNLMEEWRYRSGLFFASSGYDGLVKLWSADDWQLLRTLSTDAGKVMSVDISSDGNLLASGTYNRNFQLFAPEDV